MNIGLDIDNVITCFDSAVLKEFLKEDKNKRNNGIKNKNAVHFIFMFDWTKEEIDDFFEKNMERLSKKLRARKDCKKYIDKLLQKGHKVFLISHRVYPHYKNPEETTKEWLEKHKINYTKFILSQSADKTKECKENKINLMVDDRVDQCQKMRSCGINCILMLTNYNKKRKGDLAFASSWKSLYEEITKWGKDA